MAYTSDSGGEELFLSRLADLYERALGQNRPCTIGFLTDRQQALCRNRPLPKGLHSRFYGGFPDAQRTFFAVSPFETIPDEVFPVCCVEAAFRKQDPLTHRDFLGSLMGLGLKREAVGDILVQPGQGLIMVTEVASATALRELTKVGRVGVVCRAYTEELPRQSQSYTPVEGTVSSLRLDCLVAFLSRSSRSEASQMIAQKLVAVDGAPGEGTQSICVGEKISIRGHGKFLFEEQTGVSKKGKIRVRFLQFL